MPEYVCSGALLKCSMGLAPASLVVLPFNRTMNNNKPQANIMDYKPMVNILPFGLCRSLANPAVASATAAAWGTLTPMPCIPSTIAPWMPGNPKMLIAGKPALLKSSKLICAYAGKISLASPGQISVKDGARLSFSSSGKIGAISAHLKTNNLDINAAASSSRTGNDFNAAADFGIQYSALGSHLDFASGKNNSMRSGSANTSFLNAEAKAKGFISQKDGRIEGVGLDAGAKANVAEGGASIGKGDKHNPLAGVNANYEVLSAKAYANGFIGKNEKKYGFAFDAGAKAHVLEGDVQPNVNIPIPFTSWSIQLKAKATGTVKGAGADVGAKGYYDADVKRLVIGASAEVAAVLGLGLDIEFSIGKKYKKSN